MPARQVRISGPVPEPRQPNLETRLVRTDALSRRFAAPGVPEAAGGIVPRRPSHERIRLVADGCALRYPEFLRRSLESGLPRH